MATALLRGLSSASLIVFGMGLSAGAALAEPLRLPIASASPGIVVEGSGKAAIDIRLTEEGRRLFAKFTVANLGQKIDLRIDGKSMIQPIVREPIVGGVVQVLIDRPEEARGLLGHLNDGTAVLEAEAVPR